MDSRSSLFSANVVGWGLGIRAIGRQLLTNRTIDHPYLAFETRLSETHLSQQPEVVVNPLPLGEIPEDACINMFSYLTATELCAVRRASRQFLDAADRDGDNVWGRLCCRDFPSMARAGAKTGLPAQQQYIWNVMLRAKEEAGNLRSTRDVRKSLEAYACRGGAGVIGMASDVATLPDPRIARAVSHKRRAALWSVVVINERVIQEFRRSGLHRGPLNFLPIQTLQANHVALSAAATGGAGAGGIDRGGREMLPMAPETPAPAGFLGYVVRLIRLRPEHEHLRWAFFFAVFKDMMVFESAAQAEVVRARTHGGHIFYCSLDHVGTDHDPLVLEWEQAFPHIGHWGFRPLQGKTGGSQYDPFSEEDLSGAWGPGTDEGVDDAVERLERTTRYARSSLAFFRWR